MSIKKLFESTDKVQEIVSDASAKTLFDEGAESIRNVEQKKIDQERYIPQIDYSKPENFVRFGSARLYYESALTRIADYYPYDGSEAEKTEFLNGCLDIERYILDNQYPRSTGYATIGLAHDYTGTTTDGYGVTAGSELIMFYGGPGTGSVTSTSLKDLMPRDNDSKYGYSNIYDESIYTTAGLPSDYGNGTRTSNLKSNLDNGVTVEFWLKTGSLNPATQTNKQVIFDMWNTTVSNASGYSRFLIELTSSHGASGLGKPEQRPFMVTVQSGTHTTKDFLSLGDFSLHANMGDWNHYAIRVYNTGSNFRAQLYVNGHLNDTATRVPYDLASHVKPSTDGLAGWLSSSVSQERSWPHAIENDYSSADDLQGWWRLNTDPASGVSSKECPDSSGHGRHGTSANMPDFNSSENPSDYITLASNTFNGGNDRFNVGTGATWNGLIGTNSPRKKMSFSAWVRKTGAGGSNRGRILDFGDADVALYTTATDEVRFLAKWDGAQLIWSTGASAFSRDTWTHIAVTYDANSYNNDPKIYINGVEQSITLASGTRTGTFSAIEGGGGFIGNRSSADRGWEGQLADVAVWNNTLATSEIQSIYSAYTIKSTTHTVGELGPKNLRGAIGALQYQPPGSSVPSPRGRYGRLSGSLDEFRFWKTKRTSKQIGTNWFRQVRGGVNSDISNTTLGVYYKFNEGITGDATVDSIVLDYAGRVTNGEWTGYTAASRNTGSAIVSASAATKEFLDPIIRTNHPSYINLQSALIETGSAHDYQNASALINLVPNWITLEDDEKNNTDLKYITHVMGAYFDKLYTQIQELPKLRHQTHTSGTYAPISFAEHLPQSLGLYVPEIFVDANVMEKFTNHSENIQFQNKLHEAKNLIYQNLYNNLTDIYKSKGTEQGIKNVLKCFNVDEKLLKLKVNSNNTEFVLQNNLQQHLVRKNFLNFSYIPNNDAVIYQKIIPPEYLPSEISSHLRAGHISGNTQPGPVRYDTTGDGSIDLELPGFQAGYGHTHEANILFPDYNAENTTNLKLRPNFKQMSLFGTVTPKNTLNGKSGADLTTETTNNYADFKVYFVRDEIESKSGFFKLVAANPDDSTITLTSSVFNDVYNNELWNLSVRIKPYNYPVSNFVSGNISILKAGTKNKYEIIFAGYNAQSTDLFNSFKVSTEVPTATGTRMIGSMKRLYAGAHRTNVIGDVEYYSDVLVSSVASWSRYIEDYNLKQHALDIENIGISGSYQSMFGADRTDVFRETRNRNALVLNWNFRSASTISSADPGVIYIQDFSSASFGREVSKPDMDWSELMATNYYQAEGRFFEFNSTSHLSKKRVNSYKFIDPERPVSSDMVQIFTDEDDLTPNLRRQEILPNFVYSLEKSLYDSISEEMLDFFAGAMDFNNVIGHPVNYYRDRYKEIETLRRTFFRRVAKVSTIEQYTEYYKWFDDALTTIISQLIPASGEYINDIQNVIESHVLERNKYQNRVNIFDGDKFQLDRIKPPSYLKNASMVSAKNLKTRYKFMATSKKSSPRNTKIRANFWKFRADRTSEEITSGDSIIDAQRNKFRDVITTTPLVSSSELPFTPILATADGTKYKKSSYSDKALSNPVAIGVLVENKVSNEFLPNRLRNITKNIKSGVNFESAKNLDFAASITRPAGPINSEGGKFVPLNVMLGFVSESVAIPDWTDDEDRPKELLLRQKKTFKVQTGRDWESGLGYKNVKSSMAFPFNVFSCSVELSSGYNAAVVEKVGRNLMITNVHNDVYGDQLEKPMQGIFTNDVVGGHQSRHISLNTGNDQQNNRPEAWRILLGTCDGVPTGAIGVVGADYPPPNAPAVGHQYPYRHHEKAYLYRDFIAKRPVNIKNINTIKNNKTVPGNFEHQYEIVHSFGAMSNPRAFIENKPTLPPQLSEVNSTTNVRNLLSVRRTNDSHVQFVDEYSTAYLSNNVNKTIVLNRFSAPGGIEVMSKGYLDFKSSEMSPYNARSYRNLTVRRPLQAPSGSFSRPESDISGDTTDIQVSDIHNKDFGLRAHLARHSARFGRDPVATEATEYSLNTAMHIGYPRNTYNTNTPSGWWRLRTDVSSAGNITDSSGNGRTGVFDAAGDRPAFSTTLFPNQLIQEASCTFDGSDDAVNIGAGSLWQTIIGTGTGGTKKMTFSIWLRKTGDGGSNFGRIFGFGKDAVNGQIAIYTNASEQVIFKTDWNGGTSNVWNTAAAFSLNTWTHLAITYDANSTANDPIFYVNGTPASLVSNPTPSGNWDGIASGENCYIGNDSLGNLGWAGQLADAGIWNTILTADEIAALYKVGTLSNSDLITAVNPSSPGETYNQLPSYHKINRNPRQVIKAIDGNNSIFITSSKFDNAFIQRPIPQSDRQYMWLSNSVENVSDIRYAGFQNVDKGDQFDAFRSSSAGYEYYWTFVTASSAKTGSFFQPTSPLNIIVNDPISSSTHTLGFDSSVDVSNYTNTTLVDIVPNPDYLNQLLTSRGATYGWGWQKTHQTNNRILIDERRNNQLVIATGSDSALSTYSLRPLSMKGRMSYVNFDLLVPTNNDVLTQNITLEFTNTNEKIFFNDLSLNNYAEVDYRLVNEPYRDALAIANSSTTTLNWFLYKQNVFPSLKNEFGAFSSKRVGYDNKFWRNSRADRSTLGNTLGSSIMGTPVSKSSWPLDAPINFLTRTSIYSPTSGSAKTAIPSVTDLTYFTGETYTPLTGALAYNLYVPAAGELQNTYFSYFTVNIDGPRFIVNQLAPLYARKHVLGTPHSVVSPGGVKIPETGSWGGISNTGFDITRQIKPFAGEAMWEAAEQAGLVFQKSSSIGSSDKPLPTTSGSTSVFVPSASNPWYNDYDDYKSDLKLMSKGYAVVPEYRMSEHVKDYFNFGINNKSKQDMFEIVGTNSSSADRNFYIDYSNSDFLENFLGIKRASLLNAKEIKLTCHAAIKYNPYKGFYPAQRTVQLTKQLAESFSQAAQGSFSGSTTGYTTFDNQSFGRTNLMYQRTAGLLKLAFDPLVSPGILYNSIKSGIAVDYPIVSNHRKRQRRLYGTDTPFSTNNYALSITGSTTITDLLNNTGSYLGGQFWDKRIPFEAIIEPRKYILNTTFAEMESHPSMSLEWNWNKAGSGLTPAQIDEGYGFESFSASFSDNADGIYSLMARNFFGACGEFFLESEGITRLESNTVLNDLKFTRDENFADMRPMYMARIKLRKSHNGARTYEKEFDSEGVQGGLSYYATDGAKSTTNGTQSVGTYPLPQDPMRNERFKETFTMYSRPTAFGPPCAGRPSGSHAIAMPFISASRDSFSGFNPAFTPPYYDGEAWADLIFRPQVIEDASSTETYDLNRILNETQVVCWRFDAGEPRKIGPKASHAALPALIPVQQTQKTTFAFGSDTKTSYGAGSGSAPPGTGSAINYIKLYNGKTRYNVWFSASAGDLAPHASLHSGTAVLVDITSGGSSSAAHYADKFKTVINALSDFHATVDGTQVTVIRPPGTSGAISYSIAASKEGTISPITISISNPYVSPDDDRTVPAIYDGNRINVNSMQLTSSVKIFGTEKVLEQEVDKFGRVIKDSNKPVGTKWVIQPKWETPMLNFNDEGVHPIKASESTLTLPTYGSASVPRGMWHQFGVIPDDPNKGIFLEITDIPKDWLRNHYAVLEGQFTTPYNGKAVQDTRAKVRVNLYKHIRSLSSLCGFDQNNSSVKLGQIKESFAVHEAIVAVPYVINEVNNPIRKRLRANSKFKRDRKQFIAIPKRRFASAREQAAGSAQGDSLASAGESIRKLKQAMEKYVFPPEFDFLNNKEVDPIAMYVFEFKYEFDRDDLSYIWQNIAPRDHEQVTFQKASVSHNLTNNELINQEVLNSKHLRWMVFKVKQRAKTDYYDLIPDQANESTRQIRQKTTKLDKYKFGFNWPYDYLSFVELIKMDVDILLKK